MFINLFFKLDHGVWLVFFTITIMRPTIGNSTKVGFQRVVATLIGIGIVTGVAYLINMDHTTLIIILIISVIVYLYLQQSPYYFVSVIFLTLAMMSVYFISIPDAWRLSIERSYDTAAAFGLGFIISFIFWPNKASKRLINEIKVGMECESQYMKSIWSTVSSDPLSSKKIDTYKIKTHTVIEGYKESYHFAMLEPGGKRVKDVDLTTIIECQKKLLQISDHLDHFIRIGKKNIMKYNFEKLYNDILAEIVKTLEDVNKLILSQVNDINLDSLNERYTSFTDVFNLEMQSNEKNELNTDFLTILYSINLYIGVIKDEMKTLSESTVNFFSRK